MAAKDPGDNDPVNIHIDGILDLHAFAPQDAASVVREYLRECKKKGSMRFESFMAKERVSSVERFMHSLRNIQMLWISN